MMTTILLTLICLLLMVVYVLVKALQKAERDTSFFINELGRKNSFDSEQERRECEYSKLKRLVSLPHTGVEHQLFVVSVLSERYSKRSDDSDAHDVLSDLLGLQCFLLDVMELTATPVNNRATYGMRQQVKNLRRTLSVHNSVQEVAP